MSTNKTGFYGELTKSIFHLTIYTHYLFFCVFYSIYEPRCEKKQSLGFPTRSDKNRAVQPQKMARGLKFWILEEEGLYYLTKA